MTKRPKFIEFTDAETHLPRWIKRKRILSFRVSLNGQRTILDLGGDDRYTVIETVEEVAERIRGPEPQADPFRYREAST